MPTPQVNDQRSPLLLQMQPGFFTETSADGAPARWKDGDKVRFKNGQAEKFGGWVSFPLTGSTHHGIPRVTHEWTSLDGEHWIAEATNSKLYLINRGVRYDITPIRRTSGATNPFTTVNTSAVVTVNDPGHSSEAGDFVRFSGASAVGGLTISGEYQITAVVTADIYQITAAAPANANATGGGSVTIEYDLNAGAESQGIAVGWGTCAWGEGEWGTARDESCSDVVRPLGTWSLDNFGEDLIASPRGGAVYWWDRTTGPSSRAVQLNDAPPINQRVLTSNTGAQIICLGAYDSVGGTPDPMLIRVGAEESLTDFTVAENNTVFEARLATGSKIITGVRTRSGVLVSTDQAVYLMVADSQEIFDVQPMGENNGALAPNGMLDVKGRAYWISANKFFRFDGVVEELPCDVWQHVFAETIGGATNPTRLHITQADKIQSWYNDKFSEIYWLYPSVGGSGECDCYVIYNDELSIWYFGTLNRTAGSSSGPTFGRNIPYAFSPDGTLYRHEVGEDDDGAPMNAFIVTHDITGGDAQYELEFSQAVPNMVRQIGNILLYLHGKTQPSAAAYFTKGPYTVSATTQRKGVRITARQIAIEFRSNALGASWRLGNWRFFAQGDAED